MILSLLTARATVPIVQSDLTSRNEEGGAGGGQSVNSFLSSTIAAIAADNHSGATQIAERAADILLQRAATGEAASPDAFRQELLTTGWGLIHAQPLMAPLVNLVNIVLWKVEESETPYVLRQAVADTTKEFKRQLRHHAVCVAEGVLGLIAEGSTIVTCSHSTTVQHALLHAQRAGRRFVVICAEACSTDEERQFANTLADHGVPVSFVADAAAIRAVQTAQLVLTGADLLSSAGLVNKAGTYALALAAKSAEVPFYTLCSSQKFLPPGYHMPNQRAGSPYEVWTKPPSGDGPHRAFESIPLALISGIVTEQGTLPVAAIEAWLASLKLHPALAR
jgi:translation initiation factor 2B subunit (eIF-2B alpha/beta/delta family)